MSLLSFFTNTADSAVPVWVKVAAVALIALTILSVVGFFFYNQRKAVSDLQDELNKSQQTISTLEQDKAKLQISNDTLQSNLDRQKAENEAIRQSIEAIAAADKASNDRLTSIERKLNDPNKLTQAQAIRESDKAGLLLDYVNKQTDCFTQHVEDFTGTCIAGKFVPNKTDGATTK